MRVLCIHPGPAFSVADVHNGLVSGLLQNGVEALSFNLDDRLNFYTTARFDKGGGEEFKLEYEQACKMAVHGVYSSCFTWLNRGDVVVIMSGFYLPAEAYLAMRAKGLHVVLWCTESPYEDTRQCLQAPYADTVIVNDPINIESFRERNPRTFYIPHSYDPQMHQPFGYRPELASDFCFVGTGYPSRIEFLEKVDFTGVNAVLAGNWTHVDDTSPLFPLLRDEPGQCVDNVDAADLYRATKVSANLYRKEAEYDDLSQGWAMGPREVELAATGTFFLREPRGESDELLKMLPTFTTPAEFTEQLWWWIHPDRDSERVRLARQAQQAVAGRTFKNHAAELLRLIGA